MWQAPPSPCGRTFSQTASWSQSMRSSSTTWIWPLVAPLCQSSLRERLK